MHNGILCDDSFGPSIEGAGDKHVRKAWEAKTSETRVKWARKALEADLNCIDAYIILSYETDLPSTRLRPNPACRHTQPKGIAYKTLTSV